MPRIRLLRRFRSISATFAATVGSVMVNNAQTKPTVRPSKAMLHRAAVDTAMQFQMLMNEVVAARAELQVTALPGCAKPPSQQTLTDHARPPRKSRGATSSAPSPPKRQKLCSNIGSERWWVGR